MPINSVMWCMALDTVLVFWESLTPRDLASFFFFAAFFLVSFFFFIEFLPLIFTYWQAVRLIYIYTEKDTLRVIAGTFPVVPVVTPIWAVEYNLTAHICFLKKKNFSSYHRPRHGCHHRRAPPLPLCSPAGGGVSSVSDCMAMAARAGLQEGEK